MIERLVATFVVDTKDNLLSQSIINQLFEALDSKEIQWLKDGVACDIFFKSSEPESLRKKISDISSAYKIDWAIQPLENRKKRLLISDMDSTMIEEECIDEIAAYKGIKEHVAHITDRAMNGELDFKEALQERIALLKGIDIKSLAEIYEHHINISKGAKTLVQTMKKNGAYAILVSGGFTFFTSKVANDIGFNEHHGNILDIDDEGRLSGKITGPVLDKDGKKTILLEYISNNNIDIKNTIAIGDGANDIPMIEASGFGVAYQSKPVVKKVAKAAIDHTYLEALLYFQGYKNEEFEY